MDSICDNNGKVDYKDFGRRLGKWMQEGYSELGDTTGLGQGTLTQKVVYHPQYTSDPHGAAVDIWKHFGCQVAPNGGVMRTSILGIYQYCDLKEVKEHTLDICKVTHADPRCQASSVAVAAAVALMLQRPKRLLKTSGEFKIEELTQECLKEAEECFQCFTDPIDKENKVSELKQHMMAKDLKELKLDDKDKIGYTYKALGAGFWALRQMDFRKAIEAIIFEGGDADTNGAVAGALLGCKLGVKAFPPSWLDGLVHKNWLDKKLDRFLHLMKMGPQNTQNANVLNCMEQKVMNDDIKQEKHILDDDPE